MRTGAIRSRQSAPGPAARRRASWMSVQRTAAGHRPAASASNRLRAVLAATIVAMLAFAGAIGIAVMPGKAPPDGTTGSTQTTVHDNPARPLPPGYETPADVQVVIGRFLQAQIDGNYDGPH